MKFLVDALPKICKDCPYKANAIVMSQLGVQKQVVICTLQATLIPPTEPNQEPNFIDIDKTPAENDCPCSDGTEAKKSSLLLD